MAVLSDLKWERFAAFVSQGELQAEAYKHAGFMAKFPAQAASKLANRPEVAARIEELQRRVTDRGVAKAAAMTGITKEWILRELVDTYQDARQRGALAPANRSLELMGKEHGMFRDLEPIKPPRLEDLPSEDLERMLAQSIADNPPAEPEDQAPPAITQ